MKHSRTLPFLSLLLLLGVGTGFALEAPKSASPKPATPTVTLKIPVTAEEFADVPVAKVDGESVPLRELDKALGSAHEAMTEGGPSPKISPMELLNRLIDAKLLIREARAMGLDELPEYKEGMKGFSERTLRQLSVDDLSKDARVDPKEVEEFYRDEVKEYKLLSVLFSNEEDAKQMEVDLQAGKSFEELSEAARKLGKARGDKDAHYLKRKELDPLLEAAAGKLQVGGFSAPVPVQYDRVKGFAILRLDEIRYPEDPAARETAEAVVKTRVKLKEFTAQKEKIVKKEVKFKKKLIDSLDFEAEKPGLAALLKDKRVVVEIKGEKPVTVAELSAALQKIFFHGAERAAGAKKINKKKLDTLDGILEKRLLLRYALNKGFDKGKRYKELVEEQERNLLFGALIQKAVLPEVKLSEQELRAFYDEKKAEFTKPEMIRLRSIAFQSPADAQEALEKLQRGADFNWTRANADGRAAEEKTGATRFDGKVLMVDSLPKEFAQAISGARTGDLRVGTGPDKFAYVLFVEDRIPPQVRPFEEVQGSLGEKLFGKKLQDTVAAWTEKLRAASKIEVYLADK